MEFGVDDDNDYFEWLDSVELPTKKQNVDDMVEHEEESAPRSLIFSFLGDQSVGKSTLLKCLGCLKVIGNNKDKFKFGLCHLMKEQIGEILNAKGKLEGLLLVELLKNDSKYEWNRVIEFSDLVILVVDACCGVTSCTYEFLKCIKEKSKPFIVVFNKVDLLQQPLDVTQIVGQFKEEGLIDSSKIVSVSAVSGDGVPKFLEMLFHMSESLDQKLFTLGKIPKCKVLDVKDVLGHGMLMLVVVVDGVLHASDTVVVSGVEPLHPIVSKIKALWSPQNSGELLVAEGPYAKEQTVNAGCGVLVALQETGYPADLSLQVLGKKDDVWNLKRQAMEEHHACDARLKTRYIERPY